MPLSCKKWVLVGRLEEFYYLEAILLTSCFHILADTVTPPQPLLNPTLPHPWPTIFIRPYKSHTDVKYERPTYRRHWVKIFQRQKSEKCSPTEIAFFNNGKGCWLHFFTILSWTCCGSDHINFVKGIYKKQ